MTRKLAVIATATLIMALASATITIAQEQSERIAISELKQKLDSGERLLLIDVREDHELERDGAIPGAIHIPMGELDERMKDIPKNIQLVFY